jgi:hypothetical protein
MDATKPSLRCLSMEKASDIANYAGLYRDLYTGTLKLAGEPNLRDEARIQLRRDPLLTT